MADIKQNLLGLNSNQDFSIQGMRKNDICLNLTTVSSSTATVHDTVTDGKKPIANATTKIFDKKGLSFKHTLADNKGEYSMDGVPTGMYNIGRVEKDYRLSSANDVRLSEDSTTQIDFECAPDETLSLGAIVGVLTMDEHEKQEEGSVPLSGVKITLIDNLNNVVATTYTLDGGEFSFYDVPNGKYTLLSYADGYIQTVPITVTITVGSIANITLSMNMDTRTHNGTVSGIIRDINGHAVAGCFVGLYQIVKQENGTPKKMLVATTKTNGAGKYLFGSVSKGQYLVKAKMSK